MILFLPFKHQIENNLLQVVSFSLSSHSRWTQFLLCVRLGFVPFSVAPSISLCMLRFSTSTLLCYSNFFRLFDVLIRLEILLSRRRYRHRCLPTPAICIFAMTRILCSWICIQYYVCHASAFVQMHKMRLKWICTLIFMEIAENFVDCQWAICHCAMGEFALERGHVFSAYVRLWAYQARYSLLMHQMCDFIVTHSVIHFILFHFLNSLIMFEYLQYSSFIHAHHSNDSLSISFSFTFFRIESLCIVEPTEVY